MTASPAWPLAPDALLNMSTGPVEVSSAVMAAQAAALLSPHVDSFWEVQARTVESLQRVLMTRQRVLMFHGSIRTGIDVALGNFLAPGSRVLSVINGFWGSLIADWAEMRGAVVDRIAFGSLDTIDVNRVAEALASQDYDLVTIVHVETNSGIVNPIAEVGRLVDGTSALYMVDTACSAGAIRIDTDGWRIDIQTTGSHKCLAAVPGLAIVTLSDKAWSRLSTGSRSGAYFSFQSWWLHTMERQNIPSFTQPTTLVHALQVALGEIETIGLEKWWAIHRMIADRTMQDLRDVGFGLLLDAGPVAHRREFYSDTVMAVRYPAGVDDATFRRLLLEEHGIFVVGNLGEFEGKSFRMGLMSAPQMRAINVRGTIAALKDVLASAALQKRAA